VVGPRNRRIPGTKVEKYRTTAPQVSTGGRAAPAVPLFFLFFFFFFYFFFFIFFYESVDATQKKITRNFGTRQNHECSAAVTKSNRGSAEQLLRPRVHHGGHVSRVQGPESSQEETLAGGTATSPGTSVGPASRRKFLFSAGVRSSRRRSRPRLKRMPILDSLRRPPVCDAKDGTRNGEKREIRGRDLHYRCGANPAWNM